MAAAMKQYDPEAKQWRAVTHRSRTFTETESKINTCSERRKPKLSVELGIFANQIYLYGMGDT